MATYQYIMAPNVIPVKTRIQEMKMLFYPDLLKTYNWSAVNELKKMRLELDISDIQQILSIALDEDKDKALVYIKGRLTRQVEKTLQPH